MAYDCGIYCSSSPGPGCSSTVPGTSAPPPPPSPPPPPPPSPPPPPPAPSILPNLPTITGWGVSCADFHDFSRSSPGGICTCVTTGWPFATGLTLECLAQMPSTWAVGLRVDMQVCQDPMSFTPSVLIPLAGWQQGEPGNTVHIPTGVNASGVGSLDYVITMTGKADNINLTATVDACLLGACTPLLTLVQIKDQSLGTCAPPWAQWAVPLIAIVSVLAVCLLCGGLIYCCCCRRKTARQSDVSGAQLREVTSAAPYDTRLNEAFLSATRPSSQVPIAPLAAINTVPVFGVDGKAMPRYP